jgi:hypothetical protein
VTDATPLPLTPEATDAFQRAVIVSLLRALGGSHGVQITDLEADDRIYQWGFELQIPATPTGQLKLDARIAGGILRLQLRRKTIKPE